MVARHLHQRTAGTPEDVVRSVAALHSTDPATPYISMWTRVPGFEIGDLEHSLYDRRSLIRMHSIRRTLFLFDRDDAVWFHAGATRDIASKERERFYGWLAAVMPAERIASHVERLSEAVMETLSGRVLSTRELAHLIPGLAQEIEIGSGKWVAKVPVSTRLLLILALDGLVVRARPAGTWRSSQYRWARSDEWLGDPLPRAEPEEGRVMILRRYLETHAPATLTDIRWWTGWTAKFAREALVGVEAVEVELEDGSAAYVLPDDPGVDGSGRDVVAFLPALDSSTMGWKERAWYLGPHGGEVFDSVGNAGPTVWVGGRIVGGWGQRADGSVVHEVLDEVGDRVARRIAEEAEALGEWLEERVVMPRFPSPLGKRLAKD